MATVLENTGMRLWLAPLLLLLTSCSHVSGASSAGDDDSASVGGAGDDDAAGELPAEDVLHGAYPKAPVALPSFVATNYDGAQRGPEHLQGHPTVLWFFPFAGTPT